MSNGQRYYFRLNQSIESLCQQFNREPPTEKSLAKVARQAGYPFNEKNVRPAIYDGQSFSDGLLYALSRWFGQEERIIAHPTPIAPRYSERKPMDILLLGMEPMVKRLFRNLRLQKESFIEKSSDIERAVDMVLLSVATSNLRGTEHGLVEKELMEQGVTLGQFPSREAFRDMLVQFWNVHPMNVVYAVTTARNKVGVVSVLPLTDSSYEAMRAGELSPFDLQLNDVPLKSRNLLLFLGHVRADGQNKTTIEERTKFLASTILIVIALAAIHPLDDIRVLTVGGDPETKLRLDENGFINLNRPMAKCDWPLYEFKKGTSAFASALQFFKAVELANR